MNNYKVGDVVIGHVTGIEKYGIFLSLDLGGSGLIHISEISNSFVRNINDYVDLEEVIKAEVIGIDDSKKRLKLSIKNINYRNRPEYRSKICETVNGFSTLKNNLDYWINEKLEEWQEKN